MGEYIMYKKLKLNFNRIIFLYKLNRKLNQFNAKAIFSNTDTHTLTLFHKNDETSIVLHPSFWNEYTIHEILKQVIIKEQGEK